MTPEALDPEVLERLEADALLAKSKARMNVRVAREDLLSLIAELRVTRRALDNAVREMGDDNERWDDTDYWLSEARKELETE